MTGGCASSSLQPERLRELPACLFTSEAPPRSAASWCGGLSEKAVMLLFWAAGMGATVKVGPLYPQGSGLMAFLVGEEEEEEEEEEDEEG